MIRRVTLFAFCLLFMVASVPAFSSSGRKVTVQYHSSPASQFPPVTDGGYCPVGFNDPGKFDGAKDICLRVDTKAIEHFVSVKVDDSVGWRVSGFLVQEGVGRFGDQFCGKTKAPVGIPYPGQPVYLYVQHATCDGSPTLATIGEATLTFTR